ncbi:hypothetical protein GA0074692_1310 [Micromonospora pallida]|uniref:Uncharacterized protein n=1 Tax=Micromonospora pallida TaxID=145854 RepID=A0A1C6RYB4_9ACTN|nr:hypothetical protein GA0074692_1310 [Micromonospora pallida]
MTERTIAAPEEVGADPVPVPGSSAWRVELGRLLEVAALVGLTVTQPLLDVLGRSPDFFLFHRATPGEAGTLLALIVVAPTAALAGLGALTRLAGRRVRLAAHRVLVALLLAVLAVQVGRETTPLRGVPLLVVAGAAGVALAAAHRRWRVPGRVLRAAAVGPPVFVALFVLVSPASAVVLPRSDGGAGRGRPPDPAGTRRW